MIQTHKLKSGLRVLTIPQKNTRTVTVLVLVGTGSKYEKKRVNGISHFLEHMFFKGTKKRSTPLDIASPIENVGGTFNAFTSQDLTGYYIKVDASHLDLALDMVADIFLNSLFPLKEIEKEIANLKENNKELEVKWKNEKQYIDAIKSSTAEIDDLKNQADL